MAGGRGGRQERAGWPAERGRSTLPFVLVLAGRDVRWRARRWTIAVAGTALALAVTILLAGFLASFHAEVDATLDVLGGDGYLVREGSVGPFTTPSPLDAGRAGEVADVPGLRAATPLVTLPYTLRRAGDDAVTDVFLVGRPADGIGRWRLRSGRAPRASGEVVLDARADGRVGDRVSLGARTFTVVGTTSGVHVLAGKGVAWTTLEDAQALVFGGAPFVSAFLFDGHPEQVPAGMAVIDRDAAQDDLIRLMRPVVQSIETFRLLMWTVAAAVVGSVLYLTAVDRVRDFAVLKATGARNRELALSLLAQAAALAVVASGAGIGMALLLAPTFPTPVLFTATLFLSAPVVAVVIGAIGSLAGVRRAMATDPALAFGGA